MSWKSWTCFVKKLKQTPSAQTTKIKNTPTPKPNQNKPHPKPMINYLFIWKQRNNSSLILPEILTSLCTSDIRCKMLTEQKKQKLNMLYSLWFKELHWQILKMFFGVCSLVYINYFHVSSDPWIASVSPLLQISCAKSRISSCFGFVHICAINLTTLTLLKEIVKNKLPMMFINCRNFYLVSWKPLLKSPLFKMLFKVTLLTRSTASRTQRKRARLDT